MASKALEGSSDAVESQMKARKQGGWVTFPFLAAYMLGLGVAGAGATSNLIVYLITEFNVKSIDAAQISNIVNGCLNLTPVAGAIISDAYFGCYPVIAFSTFISFLATVLFTLTATIRSLRPAQCAPGSGSCEAPSAAQFGVLYLAVALIAIGNGGTRFTTVTMGANQFNDVKDQEIYFNWFFVILYASAIIGSTVIVYVQDSVGWGVGFGLCTAANAASVVILLAGMKYYRRPRAEGSAFTGLARVVIAAIRKRKLVVSPESVDYYYGRVGDEGVKPTPDDAPTQSIGFLNRAALMAEGDAKTDGSIAKPWSLCTVQQVEDLKSLIRITPLWTSNVFLSISIGVLLSISVLQALTMDRTIGHHFSIPAGSITVFVFASVALSLPVLDRLLIPLYQNLTRHTPTPLQRIGLGHAINVVSMAVSALVERRRVGLVRSHHAEDQPGWIVPMSVLWLVLGLVIQGMGEAFHFPGQVSLFYQEFPKSLQSTATGMVALIIALGFYLSTALVDVVRRLTTWLPDNVNDGRLDNVYWMLAVLGGVNFGYYVLCARLYKYQTRASEKVDAASDSSLAG